MSYLVRLKAIIGENTPLGELTELTKGASVSFVSGDGGGFSWCEDETAEVEERAALAAECVPAIYLDALHASRSSRPRLFLKTNDNRRSTTLVYFWMSGAALPLNSNGPSNSCSMRPSACSGSFAANGLSL